MAPIKRSGRADGGMDAGWGAWLLERAVEYGQQRQVGGKPSGGALKPAPALG
jgi:hypothetical protein